MIDWRSIFWLIVVLSALISAAPLVLAVWLGWWWLAPPWAALAVLAAHWFTREATA